MSGARGSLILFPRPPISIANSAIFPAYYWLRAGLLDDIRKPENRVERFGGLTLIVFLGGLARLIWVIAVGVPSMPMLGGLVMELVVTPLMFLWQLRLADAQRASIIVG